MNSVLSVCMLACVSFSQLRDCCRTSNVDTSLLVVKSSVEFSYHISIGVEMSLYSYEIWFLKVIVSDTLLTSIHISR
jgi:hypothetical protein